MDLRKFKEGGGKFLVAGRMGFEDGVFHTLTDINVSNYSKSITYRLI